MDTTNFKDMLLVEKQGQEIANSFYVNKLKALQIKRYNYNNLKQRALQNRDIDCSVQLEASGIEKFWVDYSEKFRRTDNGDMCIELWSDFEKKKLGWGAITKAMGGPDAYIYVTPKYIYEIWKTSGWFDRMVGKIMSELTPEKISEIIEDNSYPNVSYPVVVDGHDMTLLKSSTIYKDRSYFGICVCVPWKTIYNNYIIDVSLYDRDNNFKHLSINEIYK